MVLTQINKDSRCVGKEKKCQEMSNKLMKIRMIKLVLLLLNHKTKWGTVNKEAHTYTHLRSRTLLSMHTGTQVKQETRAMQPLYQSARGKHRHKQRESHLSALSPPPYTAKTATAAEILGFFFIRLHTHFPSAFRSEWVKFTHMALRSSSVRELNSQKSFGMS